MELNNSLDKGLSKGFKLNDVDEMIQIFQWKTTGIVREFCNKMERIFES